MSGKSEDQNLTGSLWDIASAGSRTLSIALWAPAIQAGVDLLAVTRRSTVAAMVDCGFTVEWNDNRGDLPISACWDMPWCEHQPITEYQVWAVQAVRHGPDIWHFHGQFSTRLEAREVELRTSADHYSYIQPVQFCRWPVRHPPQGDD